MVVARYLTKRSDWCMSEDEEKEIDPIFTDKVGKCQKLVEGVKMHLVRVGSI